MEARGTALSIGTFAELSAAVTRNLPRDIDRETALFWINNGKRLQRVMKESLAKPRVSCTLPVWGNATMGIHRTADKNLEELRVAGIDVDERAGQMIRNIDFNQPLTLQELSLPVAEKLGLPYGGYMHNVRHALIDSGAEFCDPALLPSIAILAKELGYCYARPFIVMIENEIEDSAGVPGVFIVGQENGKIHIASGVKDGFFDPYINCMCVRPSQSN